MTSVWRNTGTSALDLSGVRSAQAEVILDDDSCDICMGEDGACDIWFSPCGHKACASCVQKMRIANVYKVRSELCFRECLLMSVRCMLLPFIVNVESAV